MGKLERITITLPEEMVASLKAAVESGEYASASEAVREALRDRQAEQSGNLRSVRELREMIAQADAGPTVDGEEFMRQLRDRVTSEVARRGAL